MAARLNISTTNVIAANPIAPRRPGGRLRLDLGCGGRRPEPVAQWGDDWIGIDISPDCGADYVFDLTKHPWPIADESVDEIYSAHFFEHLPGAVWDSRIEPIIEFLKSKYPQDAAGLTKLAAKPTTERIAFMEECYRILKPGEPYTNVELYLQNPHNPRITLIVPYWSSMRSIQDPTHEWPTICEHSFAYFHKKWREDNKLTHYPITCDFDFVFAYALHPDLVGRNTEFQRECARDHVNSVADLSVTLVKRPQEKRLAA